MGSLTFHKSYQLFRKRHAGYKKLTSTKIIFSELPGNYLYIYRAIWYTHTHTFSIINLQNILVKLSINNTITNTLLTQ